MARLEDITVGTSVTGLDSNDTVSVVAVKWYGTAVLEVTYKNSKGHLASQLVYRENEENIDIQDNKFHGVLMLMVI